MIKNNDRSPSVNEIPIDTVLNPGFSMGVDTDLLTPSGKDYLTGESVDKHRTIEQANEFLGEEEVKQQTNNL